jgi:hypothetical protein
VGVTLVAVPTFRRHPLLADDRVLRAAPYRSSMLAWLRTGEGPESRPLATAWAHARELAVYVVVALLTANAASLVLGAVLLNYMNAWVARLVAAARRPVRVALLAWNVWSVVRVAGYVFLGAACAAPLLARLGHPADPAIARRLALAGVLAVALDLGLKLALSKPCGRLLADAVDLDAV